MLRFSRSSFGSVFCFAVLFFTVTTMTSADGVRTFEFTYTVEIPAPQAPGEILKIWIPLPQSDPGVQRVRDLTITAPVEYQVTRESVFGNQMVYLETSLPAGPTQISWRATITRGVDTGEGRAPVIDRYLTSNRLIPIDGDAREMAVKLGATEPQRAVAERAKLIFDDVLESMEYNKQVPGYGNGDFGRAVTVCKGNCTDFHARFTGIGRASKIPVRFTMGIPLIAGQNSHNSYHCWAHWHDGESWQPVDISEADKVMAKDPEQAAWFFGHLGTDRIGLTCGRDIVLSPPQAGELLNYFVFPYAEVDGKALAMDKSMWLFSWRDLP